MVFMTPRTRQSRAMEQVRHVVDGSAWMDSDVAEWDSAHEFNRRAFCRWNCISNMVRK